MAIVTINDEHLNNIASAIREKNGTADTYKPGDMATAIQAISAGGGSTGYNDFWYNCCANENGENVQLYEFDVTNANTFTFTYDMDTSSNSSCMGKVTMNAYYGYKIAKSTNSIAPAPKQTAVDSGAKYETILSQFGADTSATVTLDVSAYTVLTLRMTTYVTERGSDNYGCLYIHDITLN